MASKRWQEQSTEEIAFAFNRKLEGGRFFIVSVFAELERGQLPQTVVMLPP